MDYKSIILLLIIFSNIFIGCFSYVSNEFEENDSYVYLDETELISPSCDVVIPIIIIPPGEKIETPHKLRKDGYKNNSNPQRNRKVSYINSKRNINSKKNINTTIEKKNRKINSNKEIKR